MRIDWQKMAADRGPVAELLYGIEGCCSAHLAPRTQGLCAAWADPAEHDERIVRYECLERALGLTLEIREGGDHAARFYRRHAVHFARLLFGLTTAQRAIMGWPVALDPERSAALVTAELHHFREPAPADRDRLFAAATARLPRLAVGLQHGWQRCRAQSGEAA